MQIRTEDGVELAVEVNGDGPPLILVHGLGGAKEDFAEHVGALAQSHTVVAFDQRGHGASGKPDDVTAYTLQHLVDDLATVIDELEFERVRVLGHSMGGMSVRRFALQHPRRVEAVVFMSTCAGPIDGWDVSLLEVAVGVALDEGKDSLKELLDAFSPLNNPAYDRLIAERPGYQDFVDRKWADLSAVAWGSLIREIAYQPDDRAAMERFDRPALVLVGELDAAFLKASVELGQLVPGSLTAVLDDAGHSPQLENAPAWFAALESFLAQLDRLEPVEQFGA